MKKKRIMILGARESGKTLLANYLNEIDTPPKRTPHMVYGRNTLDVPGSYVESNDAQAFDCRTARRLLYVDVV